MYEPCKDNTYYFDSYGIQPPKEINYLGSSIFYNSDQIQQASTFICGHLCVYVLHELSKGYDLQPIITQLNSMKKILNSFV